MSSVSLFNTTPVGSDDSSSSEDDRPGPSFSKKIQREVRPLIQSFDGKNVEKIGKSRVTKKLVKIAGLELGQFLKSEVSKAHKDRFIKAGLKEALIANRANLINFHTWKVTDDNFFEFMQVATDLEDETNPLKIAQAALKKFPVYAIPRYILRFNLSPDQKKILARDCMLIGAEESAFSLVSVFGESLKEIAVLSFYIELFKNLKSKKEDLSQEKIREIIRDCFSRDEPILRLPTTNEQFKIEYLNFKSTSSEEFITDPDLYSLIEIELATLQAGFKIPDKDSPSIQFITTQTLEHILSSDPSAQALMAFSDGFSSIEDYLNSVQLELAKREDRPPDLTELTVQDDNMDT